MFADKHNGSLPANLETLGVNDRVLQDVETGNRFSYVAGRKWQDLSGDAVLAFSPSDPLGQGRNVLFSVGRVEWLPVPKFNEALQLTTGGMAGVTVDGGTLATSPAPVASPVVAGIRPIRIEIPRMGTRFVFTKVLNVRDEPLTVSALAVDGHVRDVTRSSLQLTAFLAGLVLVWWQLRRATPGSAPVTVGLALMIGSVINALIAARLLHAALILALPMLVIAVLVWLARRFWKRLAIAGENGAAGTAATTTATFVLMLFVAGGARANDVSILSANYIGAVHERAADFEATLQLSAATAGQTVPLFGEEIAVEQFSSSPSDVKLVRDGKSVSVALGRRGVTTLKLKFLVKLGGDVAKRQLVFAIPAAPSSRVALSIGEPGAAVEMPTAVSFHTATDKQQTRVEAVIGSGERIDLRWTPRVKRAAEIAATVFCQNASLIRIGGGVINTRAQFDYSVTQGELRQVRVRLPAGHR
jgi:hypothetical protein